MHLTHIGALGEGQRQVLVHRRLGRELEGVQRLVGRKPGVSQPPAVGVLPAVAEFQFQQLRQEPVRWRASGLGVA
jgi:hypothetical protein